MALPFFNKRDPEIELPPLPATATVARPNGNIELPDMDGQQFDEMERVGLYAKQARGKLRETQIQLTETTLKLESARRENGELRVSLAQAHNDLQALQSQIESQREEIASARAVLQNITLQLHYHRIPLPPVWEMLRQSPPAKNGDNHAPPLGTVDRPASGADQGAGSPDPAA